LRTDFDGNGTPDGVAVDLKSGLVSAVLMGSNGTLRWVTIGAPRDASMRPVGLSDVDADGRADLLLRNPRTGANELWLMRGLSYSVVALPALSVAQRLVSFRDFTGDGRADAFFHDVSKLRSRVWELGATGFVASHDVDPGPAGSVLAAVADVDGDAAPDLIWRDVKSQRLEAWMLDGIEPRASVALGTAPGSSRFLGVGPIDGDADEDLVWLQTSPSPRSLLVSFLEAAAAPRTAIATAVYSATRVVGMLDVTSDGMEELVAIDGSGAWVAYSVAPTLASASPARWTLRATKLTAPPPGLWRFVALD
jgi:hypothetical protein